MLILMGIHDTERARRINTKSVVGEAVAIVIDLRNGMEIGFETGEILGFKMFCFEWKCQPTQTYSEL